MIFDGGIVDGKYNIYVAKIYHFTIPQSAIADSSLYTREPTSFIPTINYFIISQNNKKSAITGLYRKAKAFRFGTPF